MAKKSPTQPEKASISREIHGLSVRFYKRTPKSNFTMDFEVMGERIQESTKWPLIADAERVADKRVRELKELKQGLEARGRGTQAVKGKMSTVGDVLALLDDPSGAKIWSEGTPRTYKSALLRLARVVNPLVPLDVRLDVVLSEATIERFYATEQGLKAPNWVDSLPMNGGINGTVRNVKGLFNPRAVKVKLGGLKLPNLQPLRDMPYLRAEAHGFVPWPDKVYQAMHEASEKLRETQPAIWLVNAMLRRLGLRDEELLKARRDWIDVQFDFPSDGMGPPERRAWLVIQNRGEEFSLLKRGRFRKLELDPELQDALLPCTGYLIADGWAENARYDLIYRGHSKWLRKLLPEGVENAKTNHQLRMYAGSKVYTEHGLEAAAHFLGHRSTATTERYYAAWLGASPMLNGKAVAAAKTVKKGV